jgi:glycosyltransferase involved in cell wall biosynthesis
MISIVTTVFNGELFVESCFECVAQQRFREFEWIIVDDGSTDATAEIINRLIARYSRIPVRFFKSTRRGRGSALNYGVERAAFEWVAILDIDDRWHPLKLQLQASLIRTAAYSMLCTGTELQSPDANVVYRDIEVDTIPTSGVELSQLLVKSTFAHSSVVARKSLLKYDERRKSQYDLELFLRLLHAEGIQIVKIDLPLTIHLLHEQQSFESSGWEYALRSLGLRLKYSVKTLSVFCFFYNSLKLIYYILPRDLRLRISKRVGPFAAPIPKGR